METTVITMDNTPAQSGRVSIRCAVEFLSLPLPLPPPLKPGGGIFIQNPANESMTSEPCLNGYNKKLKFFNFCLTRQYTIDKL